MSTILKNKFKVYNFLHDDLKLKFKKIIFCRKIPDFKNCIHNYTVAFNTCLDDGERVTKNIIANVTESLISFMCFDEGDRLARKIFIKSIKISFFFL